MLRIVKIGSTFILNDQNRAEEFALFFYVTSVRFKRLLLLKSFATVRGRATYKFIDIDQYNINVNDHGGIKRVLRMTMVLLLLSKQK